MRNLSFFIQRLRIANGEGSLFGVAWACPGLVIKQCRSRGSASLYVSYSRQG